MSKYDVYKEIAESLKPIKNCVAIFEAHIESVIEEWENGVVYAPEAANDPDNLTSIPSHVRRMTASDILYQRCSTYIHNREGTIDGELMKTLLDVYDRSTTISDKKDFEDVIKYAKEKGFKVSAGKDDKGENILLLHHK